jgi:hypothetical protein
MLNPIKWKHEDQVGLLISIIAGAGLGIVIGYLVNEMARHTYLGAHQRCHSRRGVSEGLARGQRAQPRALLLKHSPAMLLAHFVGDACTIYSGQD